MQTSNCTLRTILRSPVALRPLLIAQQPRAFYHSYEHPDPPPYNEIESKILSSAVQHVPAHGFSTESLNLGAKDAGFLDISTNLFKSPFDLVRFHLVTQRHALKHRVQFPESETQSGVKPLGVGRKIRSLVLSRLHANVETEVLGHWTEALGLMSLAENIPASLKELAALSDEMWFLAGDKSVDGSWYTKRASLSAVYAASEVFMTVDQSTEFRDTEAFLDRRLEEVRVAGSAVGGTIEWASFQAGGLMNLLRSKGVRI